MFASIIQYRLNPIFENDFLKLWKQMTELLKAEQAIKSCVLHRETKLSFVAYVTWHSKERFEESILHPQGPMADINTKMEECCNSISVPYRLYTLQENEA